jgi:large subunit ribosomal protein L35e
LEELRQELNTLRVGKVTGSGGAQKLGKIRNVRKSIAHVLIVMHQTTKANLRALYHGKKYKPKDLRQRKTRAIRRLQTPKEKSMQLKKHQRRQWAFPQRTYAVKA